MFHCTLVRMSLSDVQKEIFPSLPTSVVQSMAVLAAIGYRRLQMIVFSDTFDPKISCSHAFLYFFINYHIINNFVHLMVALAVMLLVLTFTVIATLLVATEFEVIL